MKREVWGSKLGFILAVAGSAIGLANIWRFPYMVGQNGGAAFIAIYLLCLLLIGFPVFISEILIGRKAQASPGLAFQRLSGSKTWGWLGRLTILTGFLVSSFYSAVAGWVLGYLVEAVYGDLAFVNAEQAAFHYKSLVEHPWWGLSFHALFMLASVGVLYLGVKKGIERWNKILMPALFIILAALVVKGLMLPNSLSALEFLLRPDWTLITPAAILGALGHSFFTLSLGQGTMVTYGSYMQENQNILKSCIPVVIMDTLVSIFAAFAIFTIAFSQGVEPDSGPGFSSELFRSSSVRWRGDEIIATLFFLLVVLAALTSEISAMEPSIAYFIEEKGWGRHKATLLIGLGAFLLGIPSALSTSLLSGTNFLENMDMICNGYLIPIGGFLAVVLVGWVWGFDQAYLSLFRGHPIPSKTVKTYFWLCIKYTAPILIVLVFLNVLGFI